MARGRSTRAGSSRSRELDFPGGALIGCAAGFLNVPKIKGSHTAMKSGMVAAEAVFARLGGDASAAVGAALRASWVWDELYRVRNIRPSFRLGLWAGLAYSALDTYRAARPGAVDLSPPSRPRPAGARRARCRRSTIRGPTARSASTGCPRCSSRTPTTRKTSRAHLKLRDPEKAISINYRLYDSPEQRYCPAGVYEIVDRRRRAANRGCRSTRRIACTAKPATSRTRSRTSIGLCPRAAAGRIIRICECRRFACGMGRMAWRWQIGSKMRGLR